MVDLFEEVEEKLRSERYATMARRVIPWVTVLFAAILLAYLGYWGFTVYQDRNVAAATMEYQSGLDALEQNDQTGAFSHFEASAKSGVPAYKSLSLMQEGNLRLAAGKNDEAAGLFDAAAKVSPNPIFADLASLKAALALLDTAPYPQLQRRLTPLSDSKRPYWLYAKEALAMAKLMAGRTKEAREDFHLISLSLGVTDEMRQRAQIAMALIDSGSAPTAVAAVKAAATLPPPPPPNVGQAPPEAEEPGAPSQSPAGAAQ